MKVILFILSSLVCLSSAQLRPNVTISGNNTYIGNVVTSGAVPLYNIYQKIPFAKPPVGPLRLVVSVLKNDLIEVEKMWKI